MSELVTDNKEFERDGKRYRTVMGDLNAGESSCQRCHLDPRSCNQECGNLAGLWCEGLLDVTMSNAKAKRDPIDVRYDLISPIAMRRLAVTYCEGAKRYGDRNWEKGLPVSNLVNHALAHVFAYLDGNTSEDHLTHAAWNLMAAVHMEEAMPEMIDVPARKEAVA